jgi:hypothetical protein
MDLHPFTRARKLLMRRKLLIGLCLAALISVVAGDYLFNRSSGAQDAPKKAETGEKKGDLFDILKQSLEAKAASDGVPSLPLPPPVAPVAEAPRPGLPTASPVKVEAPKPAPGQGPAIPAPTAVAPPEKLVEPPQERRYDKTGFPQQAFDAPHDPLKPASQPAAIVPPITTAPALETKPIESSLPPPIAAPAATPPKSIDVSPYGPANPPKDNNVKPAIGSDDNYSRISGPVAPPANPTPVAKSKSSPWSLHVEMVDGQTIVTATVNKRHGFKIICESLELETGKDTLKAVGKVKISGDALNGSCERLAISLIEDRLILEGAAEVQIQKTTTNVSDAKPGAFELKGETLNLRISELQSAKFVQASWQNAGGATIDRSASRISDTAGKTWSAYGKLTSSDSGYRLESASGAVILQLLVSDASTLEPYVGRTISVYGPMVNNTTVRVTHIALP